MVQGLGNNSHNSNNSKDQGSLKGRGPFKEDHECACRSSGKL